MLPRPEQNRIQVRFPLTTTYERSTDARQYLAFRSEDADQVLEASRRRLDPGTNRLDATDTPALLRLARAEGQREAAILLHERFSLPFACLILPLAGFPLAVSLRRSGRSSGVLLAMVLCFCYWMVSLAGTALAEQSVLEPALSAWGANGLFAALGLLLVLRVDAPSRRQWQVAAASLLSRTRNRLRRIGRGTWDGDATLAGTGTRGPIEVLVPVLDRYVLRSFLFHLAVFLAAFIAIWYVFSFFELLTDMLARNKTDRFVPYLYYLTPFLVYNTAPLAVMVSALTCLGLLAKRHELTAFRACGVSLYRIACPILLVVAGLSGGLFALEESYLPAANRLQDALRDEIKGRPPRTYLRPDRQWTFGLRDRIFYHRAFDSRAQAFSGISVFDIRSEPFELRRHVQAERAEWDADNQAWVFFDGWARGIEGIRTSSFEQFDRRAFPDIAEPPDYFLKRDRHDQQMNLAQLKAYVADLTQSGFDTVRLQVQMHKKLSFPVFAFSMALLAIPFAMLTGSRGAVWPVGLGIGLTIAYYTANALAEQLGRTGQLEPPVAAWSPCLLFAIVGTYFMLRVRT